MRFGLGPKYGGPAALSASPNAALQALLAEVRGPAPLIPDADVRYPGPRLPYALVNSQLSYATCCKIGANETNDEIVAVLSAERGARLRKHMEPTVGFVEQLVIFWSNHFSISSKKSVVRTTVGNMEREAIRPNVLGNFSDMLRDVITHPAMIRYLDNDRSYGLNSVWGTRQLRAKRITDKTITYNENLAREILELHTLGINYDYSQTPNYTQNDVTTLAKVITGWTVYGKIAAAPTTSGQFYFNPDMHESGSQTVLGQSFPQSGQDQGLAVLDMLAAHPATASHIARKLLQHFVCDVPDETSVAHLAGVFTSSGGNLKTVADALVRMEVAWSSPLERMRQPYPWMVSIFRGLGVSGATLTEVEGVRPGSPLPAKSGHMGPHHAGWLCQRQLCLDDSQYRPPAEGCRRCSDFQTGDHEFCNANTHRNCTRSVVGGCARTRCVMRCPRSRTRASLSPCSL